MLLLGAFVVRIVIAYVLFPSSGFQSDIDSYASWALTLGQHGPSGFYANAGFSDYPPAYLYLLWPIGLLANSSSDAFAAASGLVKLPPMLLDLAVGYVIYRLVLGWSWPGRRAETMALVAAALYLFNPVSFYDSALWGQTDAAGALILLLGVAALVRGNSEGAAALAATAAVVKPQFGVVLIPLVAFMLVKRHLARPGSGPHHPPWGPDAIAGWLERHHGPVRLLTSLAAALAAFFVLALPFGLGILEYLQLMTKTAGGYSYLSVNAFNAWALLGSGGAQPLAESLGWSEDTVPFLGPLPAVAIGAALLVAGYLWGLARAAARDDRWTLLVAITFLAIAFFVLPTRVHERYIFPVIALMPILAVANGRWAIALLLLTLGAFVNLHAVLTIGIYGTDNVTSLPLGEMFRTRPLIWASALLQTGVGLWAAWQLRPGLRTSPDGFDRAATPTTAAPAAPAASPSPGGGLTAAVPAATVGADYPELAPEPGTSEAWVRGPGTIDWLVDKLTPRRPLRRDRSAELSGEPGGRIARLDVLVLVVLIIGAATLRGFNLDKPAGMYFDEVYHARTATEFLQRWEYGESHDIYEFTHPHLAKYAMAWGIRVAGGNEVKGTTDLGVAVRGAALERRWSEPDTSRQRNGDRLYVGTGDELRTYDLATREQDGSFPIRAGPMAVDQAGHRLFVADPEGAIFVLDTTALDARRLGLGDPGGLEAFSAGTGAPVDQIVVSDVSVIVLAEDGALVSYDAVTGEPFAQRLVDGVTDLTVLPWAERVVVDGQVVGDEGRAAGLLADALDLDPAMLEVLLAEGFQTTVIAAYLDDDERAALTSLIDEGAIEGVTFDSAPLLAVTSEVGVGVVDALSLDIIEESLSETPSSATVLVERGLGEPTLYTAGDAGLETIQIDDDGPGLPRTVEMPGEVYDVAWNEPANLVHALGEAPGGGPTVYVVEPNGNAVFIDVPLPIEPVHLLADTQPQRPGADRGELLAVSADGAVATVGISQNGFGWRIPGVLLGAFAAGLVYLLARVLFRRRSIGLIAALLVIAEGMLFANSRIAMNDVYVTTLILAATLLFAPLYLEPRKPWTAIALLAGAGIALGLALTAKWVGVYAIGGLALLVLLRSGLGRIIALVGMIAMTAVLGALAIRPAPVEVPNLNWEFLALMLALTGSLAAAMVRRPLPILRGEAWLAVLGPVVLGAVLVVLSLADGPLGGSRLLLAGVMSIAVGVVVGVLAWIAGRFGLGPFSEGARAPDASTSGWLQPGWLGGVPWLLTLAALVLLPIGVYVLGYAPWVDLGNRWGLPLLDSLPFLPSGGTGQTLPELTRSMYEYHDNLRAEHAASSPWWAWPLNLKPVWFYQERFAGATTALIYDTGNLVIFWLGLPALAFSAWMAWRRRSVALALVVLMWAALLLPWARIDRATFQYHVYASLPFLVLSLSYFLGELWHGPGPRTWALARVSAALAILAVPLLWLLRTPLCILAGTAVAHPDGVACAAQVVRPAQMSEAGTTALFVFLAGVAMMGLIAWRASRLPATDSGGGSARRTAAMSLLVVVALATIGGVIAALWFLDSSSPVPLALSSDVYALAGLVLLSIPAALVIRARDARRLVAGVVALALLWLLVWYPNISGLPLPSDLAHNYQGLLPTWNWDFQFAVNTDVASEDGFIDVSTLIVGAISVIFVAGVAVAASLWGRSKASEGDAAAGADATQR
jgi:hypothetical protein